MRSSYTLCDISVCVFRQELRHTTIYIYIYIYMYVRSSYTL